MSRPQGSKRGHGVDYRKKNGKEKNMTKEQTKAFLQSRPDPSKDKKPEIYKSKPFVPYVTRGKEFIF